MQGRRAIHSIELIDVAGLVPDAHLGKGLGNEFLDALRVAEAVIHVLDASGVRMRKEIRWASATMIPSRT